MICRRRCVHAALPVADAAEKIDNREQRTLNLRRVPRVVQLAQGLLGALRKPLGQHHVRVVWQDFGGQDHAVEAHVQARRQYPLRRVPQGVRLHLRAQEARADFQVQKVTFSFTLFILFVFFNGVHNE